MFVALTVTASPDRRPLTVGVPSFVTRYRAHRRYLFATSPVASVPLVVPFVLVERHLIGGLTAGSVR